MSIPDSFIEELKLKNDITDIVSSFVNVKRHGRNLVGLCPFHAEKTPSFNIYPDSGSFYCFGCGVGGDVITFIEKIENLDYIDAVKYLADKAGIVLPENNEMADNLSNLRRRIFEANRCAAHFFHKMLYSDKGKEALNYLKKRGLSDKTIVKYGLGFAPNSKYLLIDHLKEKGLKPYEISQANLAFQNSYNGMSSRFVNRVMFPIIDLRGNVIAFGGRTMLDIKPKYLNTSDTMVFKKSENLFSLNFAKSEQVDSLILVEGYMDVIALYQAGFKNAIATLGTALTQNQAKILSRYAKEIIICYDSDLAGQKAAQRAIELLRQTDVLIKVLTIPGAKDPDEYIKEHGNEGAIRFKKLLDSCNNDIEYNLQKALKKYDINTTDGKIAYLKESIKILSKISSKIEQEIYAGKISELVDVDKSTIMAQLLKEINRQKRFYDKEQFKIMQKNISGLDDDINKDKRRHLRAAIAEESLIAFIINNPQFANNILSKIVPENFCTEFNKKIYNIICKKLKENRSFSLSNLKSELKNEEISKVASFLAREYKKETTLNVAYEYIQVILNESEKIEKDKIEEVPEEKIKEYLQKLKELKK